MGLKLLIGGDAHVVVTGTLFMLKELWISLLESSVVFFSQVSLLRYQFFKFPNAHSSPTEFQFQEEQRTTKLGAASSGSITPKKTVEGSGKIVSRKIPLVFFCRWRGNQNWCLVI